MRRHTLALTAAAALVVGAPATASAQTWQHDDPAGDVYHSHYDDNTEEETEAIDPSVTEGDVVHTTVAHNPRKIVVTTRYRELTAPTGEADAMYFVLVKTNEKVRRVVTVAADVDHPRGVARLQKYDGHRARCRGLARSIDYTANTVTISVPRSCVSKPRWVRVAAANVRSQADADYTTFDDFIDDNNANGLGDEAALSPRLRRG